jgi:hypothetical protein
MKPLPASRYEFATWKKVLVGIDYHVEFDGHYYSVPHSLVKQKLELRATVQASAVRIHQAQRHSPGR